MTINLPPKLTANFSVAEATTTNTGLDNSFDTLEQLMNAYATAQRMESVRIALNNQPIIVSSWYRNALVNARVGGVSNSAHMTGYAVDFKCPRFGTPRKIVKYLSEQLDLEGFDQLILEYDSWVHISFAPTNHRQVMAIYDASKGYIQGVPQWPV